MGTVKKVVLALCGSTLIAVTLFNTLRIAELTRQVQSLESRSQVGVRQAPNDNTACRVLRVVDGDTVEIEADTRLLKVRVIGIDTPETVEPGGPEATERARALLEGQAVILHYDPQHDRWDKYGRLLAYLELPDGRDFGLIMIAEKYAVVYTKYPFSRQDSYLAAVSGADR